MDSVSSNVDFAAVQPNVGEFQGYVDGVKLVAQQAISRFPVLADQINKVVDSFSFGLEAMIEDSAGTPFPVDHTEAAEFANETIRSIESISVGTVSALMHNCN